MRLNVPIDAVDKTLGTDPERYELPPAPVNRAISDLVSTFDQDLALYILETSRKSELRILLYNLVSDNDWDNEAWVITCTICANLIMMAENDGRRPSFMDIFEETTALASALMASKFREIMDALDDEMYNAVVDSVEVAEEILNLRVGSARRNAPRGRGTGTIRGRGTMARGRSRSSGRFDNRAGSPSTAMRQRTSSRGGRYGNRDTVRQEQVEREPVRKVSRKVTPLPGEEFKPLVTTGERVVKTIEGDHYKWEIEEMKEDEHRLIREERNRQPAKSKRSMIEEQLSKALEEIETVSMIVDDNMEDVLTEAILRYYKTHSVGVGGIERLYGSIMMPFVTDRAPKDGDSTYSNTITNIVLGNNNILGLLDKLKMAFTSTTNPLAIIGLKKLDEYIASEIQIMLNRQFAISAKFESFVEDFDDMANWLSQNKGVRYSDAMMLVMDSFASNLAKASENVGEYSAILESFTRDGNAIVSPVVDLLSIVVTDLTDTKINMDDLDNGDTLKVSRSKSPEIFDICNLLYSDPGLIDAVKHIIVNVDGARYRVLIDPLAIKSYLIYKM